MAKKRKKQKRKKIKITKCDFVLPQVFTNESYCEKVDTLNVPLVVHEDAKYSKEFVDFIKQHRPNATSEKFKPFYKEKRVYKARPFYESFEQFPDKLKSVFELAVATFGNSETNIDWIFLKRFLNDKTHPRFRWLWGFALRHRGTEKIKIENNDILVLQEWEYRTGKPALIDESKLYIEDEAKRSRLHNIINFYNIRQKWLEEAYLKELAKDE